MCCCCAVTLHFLYCNMTVYQSAALAGPGPYAGLPTATWGHSAVAIRSDIYTFGGISSSADCGAAVANLPGLHGTQGGAPVVTPCSSSNGGLQNSLWRYSPASALWTQLQSASAGTCVCVMWP